MTDEEAMERAMELARAAAEAGEVPVGAVLLSAEGQVLAEAHNAPITRCDPSAHAEMLALRQGAEALGNYRLTGCTLVVTLEPCAMCAGAISHARIGRLVYGASDPKGGAVAHGPELFEQPTLHHRPEVSGGLRAEEAGGLLKGFFRLRRR
ncbi:tRNA adenosine(34) deaminase TadA [Parvularcula maris]|uniref:tRNA-specific adenosine deaminase n=1 Tax=Parvularcula maris TaxID=2965077 RepID=A0A9X2RJK0_9PROT|nr:tRNA adenosine(34) deaminase TadA [Parvularcula maris]MCQ8184787.1 tRNA adenosine(34) deaminase TadA [Parvularcula maris]